MNTIRLYNLKIRAMEQLIYFIFLSGVLFLFNSDPRTYLVAFIMFILMLIVTTVIPRYNKRKKKSETREGFLFTFAGASVLMIIVSFTTSDPMFPSNLLYGFFLYYSIEMFRIPVNK